MTYDEKQTPKQTVHNWCHYCVQSRSDKDVEKCGGYLVYATGNPCPFHEYRTGEKRISVKVFRRFCLECMGGDRELVSECDMESCPIHPYRFGKNPARRGMGGNPPQNAREPRKNAPESTFVNNT